MKEPAAARIPLLWLLLPFSIGICLKAYAPELYSVPLGIISVVLLATSFARAKKEQVTWAISLFCGILLAGYAYTSLRSEVTAALRAFPEREAILEIEPYKVYANEETYVSGLATIKEASLHLEHLTEKSIYFSLQKEAIDTLEAGATYKVMGLSIPVEESAVFASFEAYLHRKGIAYKLTRGRLLQLTEDPSSWDRFLAETHSWIQRTLQLGLDSNANHTRIYTAMLLGLKSELTPNQKDIFLKSGTMHLFAISGLHIGVIAACLHSLLLIARVPRPWIPLPNLLTISLFVMATGGAPSAWRALIMIACYYLCQLSRRQTSPLNALVLSALICLIIDPRQLYQAGFQMSYAAVAAILLFGIPFSGHLFKSVQPFSHLPRAAWIWPHKLLFKIVRSCITLFSISVSTFMVSSFLGMLYFNVLPTYGLLANIALLPLASLAIIAGFSSIACSLLHVSFISSIFNHAAAVLLELIEKFLHFVSSLQGSHLRVEATSPILLGSLVCLVLASLAMGYAYNWQMKLKWMWAPPIVAISLALGIALFN